MRYTLDNAIGPTRPWEACSPDVQANRPPALDDYNPETGENDSRLARLAYAIRHGTARPMALVPSEFWPDLGHVMMDLPLTGVQRQRIDQSSAARQQLLKLLTAGH